MSVLGVDHFGATVSDVEASLRFWRDLLGLEVTGRGTVEWEHLDRLVALEDTRIEWVDLAVPGGGMVELSQYHRPSGKAVAPGDENQPGCSHISLQVDDLAELLARLQDGRVTTRTANPVDLVEGAYAGAKAAYVFDPDGIEIELIELARAKDH